jgi:hypothetical protein
MMRNLYEVFDEFEKQPTKEDRINVLRRNDSHHLRMMLRAAFHPNIKFFLEKFPYYDPQSMPVGTGDPVAHILNKLYIFERGNPRAPAGLTDAKRDKLLIQFLEGLEAREATLVLNMMMKNLKVKNLTYKLVKEVFPDILPDGKA